MKKILLVLILFLGACGSYDLPVQVLDNSQDYNYSSSETSTSKKKEKKCADSEYEKNDKQNYRDYIMQREMQCALGYGYDKQGEPCDNNIYYQAYQTPQQSCCECNQSQCGQCTSCQ